MSSEDLKLTPEEALKNEERKKWLEEHPFTKKWLDTCPGEVGRPSPVYERPKMAEIINGTEKIDIEKAMAKEIKIEGKKNKNGIIDIEVPDSEKPLNAIEMTYGQIPVGARIKNSDIEVVKPQTGLDEYEDDSDIFETKRPGSVLKNYQKDVAEHKIKRKYEKSVLTPEEEETLKEKFIQEKTDEIMKGIEDWTKGNWANEYVPGEDKTEVKEAWNEEVHKVREALGCLRDVFNDYKCNMDKLGRDTLKKIGIIETASKKKEYEKPECKVSYVGSPEEENMPKNMAEVMPKNSFDGICLDLMDLHRRKNKDYGNAAHESYKEFGITSYVIRLNDKLNRLKSLTKPGTEMEIKDESIIDTLKDLAAYAIMAIESLRNA